MFFQKPRFGFAASRTRTKFGKFLSFFGIRARTGVYIRSRDGRVIQHRR